MAAMLDTRSPTPTYYLHLPLLLSVAGAHGLLPSPRSTPQSALVRHGRHRQRAAPLGRAVEAAAERGAAAGEGVQRCVPPDRVSDWAGREHEEREDHPVFCGAICVSM